MRVGLVAPPWIAVPPTGYGGTEAVVDRLARALVRVGHEVTLVAHPKSMCEVELVSFDGPWEPTPLGATVVEAQYAIAAYERLAGVVDVIHDHTVLGALVGAQGIRRCPPVVVTNHGPFDAATSPVFKRIAGGAAVTAISADHARHGSEQGVPVVGHVPHGLDADEIHPGPGDGGYALFLGRMCPDKGVHVAIEIAQRAGVPLVIAGKNREPAEHAYFDAMVRPRLGPGVEFVGEVGGTEKQDLLGCALTLLNPIQWPEPFGLVMLEALAAGTPVLAHPAGAAPEIVDHGVTGYLSDDLEDLAGRLARLAAAGPDLGQRERCRERALACFSSDHMASSYVDLYAQVIARRGR